MQQGNCKVREATQSKQLTVMAQETDTTAHHSAAQHSSTRLHVDVVQAKLLGVAVAPLKVVQQAPHKVAAHVNIVVQDGLVDLCVKGEEGGRGAHVQLVSAHALHFEHLHA
jgi:hypothetical protein